MSSTLALGHRLRHLYVNQLGFLPKMIKDGGLINLRATHYKRAEISLQQVFSGLYPENTRLTPFSPPQTVIRKPEDETLLPNEDHCPRFIQLFEAFSRRTAERCEIISHQLRRFLQLTPMTRECIQRNELSQQSTPKMDALTTACSCRLEPPPPWDL